MSTHVFIQSGETRKVNFFDSRLNPINIGELLILIDFDELNLKFDRFDLFSLILTEDSLIDDSNLVYFKNRADKKNIIIEKVDTELDDSLLTVGHDIALEFNLNNLVENLEKIVMYLEFINVSLKTRFFKSVFQTNNIINHSPLFKGNVNFSIVNREDGRCYLKGTMSEFSLLNKLATIKKVGQYEIEVQFHSEVIQVEISEVINRYLIPNNAN